MAALWWSAVLVCSDRNLDDCWLSVRRIRNDNQFRCPSPAPTFRSPIAMSLVAVHPAHWPDIDTNDRAGIRNLRSDEPFSGLQALPPRGSVQLHRPTMKLSDVCSESCWIAYNDLLAQNRTRPSCPNIQTGLGKLGYGKRPYQQSQNYSSNGTGSIRHRARLGMVTSS